MPFPTPDMALTHIPVVSDLTESLHLYEKVPGAKLCRGGSWIAREWRKQT